MSSAHKAFQTPTVHLDMSALHQARPGVARSPSVLGEGPECHPCLPCKLYSNNAGAGMLGLGASLGSPSRPLSSKEHKARTFLRSQAGRGPTESGHGQSPGLSWRRAGSRGVPGARVGSGLSVRGTGPPGEADGGGTLSPCDPTGTQ